MKSGLLVAAVVMAALALPAAALAKGASEATIEGPGLENAIVLGGGGEPGTGTHLAKLAEESGFYPAVFGQSPDPMLHARPKGELGPRYTITWVMPTPSSKARIRQDVMGLPARPPVPGNASVTSDPGALAGIAIGAAAALLAAAFAFLRFRGRPHPATA